MHAYPTAYDILTDDDERTGIRVELRDPSWAITSRGLVLSHDDTWHYEPLPSNRTDEWKNHHRFGLEEAIERAILIAEKENLNGNHNSHNRAGA